MRLSPSDASFPAHNAFYRSKSYIQEQTRLANERYFYKWMVSKPITIYKDTVTAQCIHLTRLLSLDLSLLSSSLSLLPLLLSRPLSLCFSLSTSWTLSLSRRFSLSLFTSFSLSLLEDFLWGLSLPLLLRWRFLEVSRGSSLLSLLSEVDLLAV